MSDSSSPETKEVVDGRLTGAFWPIRSSRAFTGDVWHFTDASGLHGIVTSGELRASSTVLLNDPQELRYGARRVSRWWHRNRGTIASRSPGFRAIADRHLDAYHKTVLDNPAYVVCASEKRLLSQWRNYSSSKGFAIKIHAGSAYGIVDDQSSTDKARTTSTPKDSLTLLPTWVRVAYKPDQQDAYIRKTVEWLASVEGPVGRLLAARDDRNAAVLVEAYVAALVASMKHPAYREEREVRLITYLPRERLSLHYPSSRGVVPYVRIMATTDPNLTSKREFKPLPIREVRVGPPQGASERQRMLGVESLLRTHAFSVPVKGSKIPFIP